MRWNIRAVILVDPTWDEMNRLQIFIRKVPSKPNENEHVFLGWQAP